MTALANSRTTLRRWCRYFLATEVVLLLVLLLLAWLDSAQWEARVLLANVYMVLGFVLLCGWVLILIGHHSQLTSWRLAFAPCWLPFAFVGMWLLFTLFSN